jgi:hypothetical protein
MLSCLLGCASSNNSGVEVPRPSVRGAAAPVGVQLQPPALLRLHPRANPAVHPLCRPEGCAEEEDEAGKRTHLSLSLSSLLVRPTGDTLSGLKRDHCSMISSLEGACKRAPTTLACLYLSCHWCEIFISILQL